MPLPFPLPDEDQYDTLVVGDRTDPEGIVPDLGPDSESVIFSDDVSSHTMSTLQSKDAAEYFRSFCGGTFAADENVPLVWPADATAERLDILLHLMVRICRDGRNVPADVDRMLRMGGIDRGGARVLDMVTNSGTWVNEMAGTYSTARFTSIDIKPLVPHKPHARIECQVYDCHAGIAEPNNTFDLVHLRRGVYATKDFNLLLREVHRVLKPGGYLMVTEIPAEMFEGPTDKPEPIHSAPVIARATEFVRDISQAEGVDIDAWLDLSARLEPTHPLWDNQPLGNKPGETKTIRGFRDISHCAQPCPIGPWSIVGDQKVLGGLTQLWSVHHARSGLPLVLSKGYEENQAVKCVAGVVEEIMKMEQYGGYLICHMWSARKI